MAKIIQPDPHPPLPDPDPDPRPPRPEPDPSEPKPFLARSARRRGAWDGRREFFPAVRLRHLA